MNNKIVKEIIHKTEYIDKQLPTIILNIEEISSITDNKKTLITISDITGDKALVNLNKLLLMLGNKNGK